jgi:hypothetical protein
MLTPEQRMLLQRETSEAIRIGFYLEAETPQPSVNGNQIYGQINAQGTLSIIDNINNPLFNNNDRRVVARGRTCNTIDIDKLIYYAYMTSMPIPDGINKRIRYNITQEDIINKLLANQPGEKKAFTFERHLIPEFNIDQLRYYYVLYSLTKDQLCKALQAHLL